MPKSFVHGGKAGDCILHLSVIATYRSGNLRLWPAPYTGGSPWGHEFCKTLLPLLESQPYVKTVSYSDQEPRPDEVNLDQWRWHWSQWLNISDMLHCHLGLPCWPRQEPWLHITDPLRISRVVFARGPRYLNPNMPWKQIHAKYKKYDPVFVGHPQEHRDLMHVIGPVAYFPTQDYLKLARVIAGAELCVMSQSSPHAICEGLKRAKVLEVAPHDANCHWERPDATYIVHGGEDLPDLDGRDTSNTPVAPQK